MNSTKILDSLFPKLYSLLQDDDNEKSIKQNNSSAAKLIFNLIQLKLKAAL
jgi:hypothetical protein